MRRSRRSLPRMFRSPFALEATGSPRMPRYGAHGWAHTQPVGHLLRSAMSRQRSGAQGAGEQGAPVAGSGLGEDRFEVVLDGVFGDEHVPGDVPGAGPGDQVVQEFGLARVSPDARTNTDTPSPGAAGSMLTAMSRAWAGWAVPILAARSVSHRPSDRCTRASGGLSLTPASVASSLMVMAARRKDSGRQNDLAGIAKYLVSEYRKEVWIAPSASTAATASPGSSRSSAYTGRRRCH